MDGPAIITQVTNPKEDEGRARGAGEKGEEGRGRRRRAGVGAQPAPPEFAVPRRRGLGDGCARPRGCGGVGCARRGGRECARAGGGRPGVPAPAGSVWVVRAPQQEVVGVRGDPGRRRVCVCAQARGEVVSGCVFLAGFECALDRGVLRVCAREREVVSVCVRLMDCECLCANVCAHSN